MQGSVERNRAAHIYNGNPVDRLDSDLEEFLNEQPSDSDEMPKLEEPPVNEPAELYKLDFDDGDKVDIFTNFLEKKDVQMDNREFGISLNDYYG